jgi:AcrR family transcriptional regulator
MDAPRHPLQDYVIGQTEIEGGAHVCGLFESPGDLYGQLLPFIAQGIGRGERAVHIIDPISRDDHLARMAAAGIDVEGALARRQLEVRPWAEFYLKDGNFEPSRTVDLFRELLIEGRALGYPATRAIGFMEWTLEPVQGARAISTYEALLDVALRQATDAVVCAYDVRRHRATVIADALAIHPYALVEGRLRRRRPRRGPRDRILETAARLFHRHGIAATGIERVIAEAGVAKVTFYRQFRSKEDLVLAWIADPATRWFDQVMERAHETAVPPRGLVGAIFDATAEWLERDGFRGCPYLNTIAELAAVETDHRVRSAATRYIEEIRERLRREVVPMGGDPGVGDELQVLLTGAIALAVAYRSTLPFLVARDAAAAITRPGASDT